MQLDNVLFSDWINHRVDNAGKMEDKIASPCEARWHITTKALQQLTVSL